ncbi:MAG TPA: hypothetical protein VKW06_07015 [Candidatus Angelobacter sp.]|nr:hypothetical protein [Candidatus Angelobacter sp.]
MKLKEKLAIAFSSPRQNLLPFHHSYVKDPTVAPVLKKPAKKRSFRDYRHLGAVFEVPGVTYWVHNLEGILHISDACLIPGRMVFTSKMSEV